MYENCTENGIGRCGQEAANIPHMFDKKTGRTWGFGLRHVEENR
jgi:hypothetical protein